MIDDPSESKTASDPETTANVDLYGERPLAGYHFCKRPATGTDLETTSVHLEHQLTGEDVTVTACHACVSVLIPAVDCPDEDLM